MNFDGLTFLTAPVLFNRSDYLDYSNKDSDQLIVTCLMRVQSMVTKLLFALQIKFVLKVESNAWGIFCYKKNREALTVLSSVVKHLGSG